VYIICILYARPFFSIGLNLAIILSIPQPVCVYIYIVSWCILYILLPIGTYIHRVSRRNL